MLFGLGVVLAPFVQSADDLLKQGEDLYKRCQGCHQVGPDAVNQFGPPLNGLSMRGAGKYEGYEYSSALTSAVDSGLVWDESTLDAFLAKPMEYIPGTKMAFPGVDSADERKALAAYLFNIDEKGSFLVEPGSSVEKKERPEIRTQAVDRDVPGHGVLHLGREALEEEVEAWDIDIRPDGTGLPTGKGDALTGVDIYDAQCAACHGDFGEGVGRWPVLAGGAGTLTDERPEKTIGSYWPYLSTVYDYVRRAMPFGNARSLTDDEIYSVTAYLLYLNDLVDEEDFELSSDNFMSIEMPNADGFTDDQRAREAHYSLGDMPCMADCMPGEPVVTQRARILDVTPDE